MRASDGGEPARLSNESALLRVNVTRNRFAPRFNSSEYSARIRQDLGVGNGVVRLFASDDDPPVSSYFISLLYFYRQKSRYSQQVRLAERSKAPDSRVTLAC